MTHQGLFYGFVAEVTFKEISKRYRKEVTLNT